jgi:hypothetical protein
MLADELDADVPVGERDAPQPLHRDLVLRTLGADHAEQFAKFGIGLGMSLAFGAHVDVEAVVLEDQRDDVA